jgi:hypothetical protein
MTRDDILLDRLPQLSRLTRRDYERQGLPIPETDNPRCRFPEGSTVVCLMGFHFQVIPQDACWRLRKHVQTQERNPVQPVTFECRCATWTEGDATFPPSCRCAYSGQLFALERCPDADQSVEQSRAETRRERVEAEAQAGADELAEKMLAKKRAKELLGETVLRFERQLDLEGGGR